MNKRISLEACNHVYDLLEECALRIKCEEDPVYDSLNLKIVLNKGNSNPFETEITYCPICGKKIKIQELDT